MNSNVIEYFADCHEKELLEVYSGAGIDPKVATLIAKDSANVFRKIVTSITMFVDVTKEKKKK